MRLPFRARTRTRIDLCFNAALQPMHRGYRFTVPALALLKRIAPGSRLIHEGSLVDERAEIVRSDVCIEVTGDATDVLRELTRVLETDHPMCHAAVTFRIRWHRPYDVYPRGPRRLAS